MVILFPWILFRLITSFFVTLISAVNPLTELEKTISILPIAVLDKSWLERAFLYPWLRWDAVWFQNIVESGYHALNGTAQFHPLFPALGAVFYTLGLHPLLSLLLVSSVSSLFYFSVFYKLAKIDLTCVDARLSVLLMLLAPASIVLFAPYSESLFLLCATLCFLYARRQRWWLAGLAGGMAALTRQQGILLVLPLAYEIWEYNSNSGKPLKSYSKNFLSLLIIPFCYTLWISYRTIVLDDTISSINSFHQFIYTWLISPSAVEVVPQQSFTWPWRAIWLTIQKLVSEPDVDIWVNSILTGFFLALFGLAWKKMKPAYRIYTILILLVSFSYYTGPIHPYMGLPRHLLLAMPVFIYAAPTINRPILRPVVLTLLGIAYFLQLFLYSLEAWVV